MLGKIVTTLAVLVAATLPATTCAPQGGNIQWNAAMRDPIAREQRPFVDTCLVARHPERYQGQKVRLRAIVIQDIEYADLTAPNCRWRVPDGMVGIAYDQATGDFSEVDVAVMEARRRSTATRTLAAEAEFEGTVRAHRRAVPRNETRPGPEFVAMIQVEKIDHVRLVELPAEERPES